MKFLIDESCCRAISLALADAGHDLLVASEVVPGAPDARLAEIAVAEEWIIVSEDYDFGDLAIRDGVALPGLVLVAVGSPSMAERAARVAAVVAEFGDTLLNHLAVIEKARTRRRRLR